MLVDALVMQGLEAADQHIAEDIRIGLGYTAVRLEDGRCGLGYTLHEKEYESCCVMADAGRIAGRKASELIPWLKSTDATTCAVGLATLNAIIAQPIPALESDILELLSVEPEDVVGMIGYFGPLVAPLRKRVRALHIFERKQNLEYGILPESATKDLLPQCQVVILSATTLLNRTMDGLLALSKNAREVAVLGPSTPFLPEIFTRHGVTLLSGLQVTDAAQILQTVSEGGGTRQFGRAVRKLSLRCASR